MCVSLQHPQLFMAADGAHLGNIEPPLEQTGNGFMPKVMKWCGNALIELPARHLSDFRSNEECSGEKLQISGIAMSACHARLRHDGSNSASGEQQDAQKRNAG